MKINFTKFGLVVSFLFFSEFSEGLVYAEIDYHFAYEIRKEILKISLFTFSFKRESDLYTRFKNSKYFLQKGKILFVKQYLIC
jgi:hypothetical protein